MKKISECYEKIEQIATNKHYELIKFQKYDVGFYGFSDDLPSRFVSCVLHRKKFGTPKENCYGGLLFQSGNEKMKTMIWSDDIDFVCRRKSEKD